jgi:hypothetical protein
MAAKKQRPVVIETKRPDLRLAVPTLEQWDRYIQQLARGQELPGKRGLLQACCVDGAEHAEKQLARFPAAIAPIVDKLGDCAGEDIDPDVDEDASTVKLGALEFSAPTLERWESLLLDLGAKRAKIGPILREFLSSICSDPAAFAAQVADRPGIIFPLRYAVAKIVGAECEIVVKKG